MKKIRPTLVKILYSILFSTLVAGCASTSDDRKGLGSLGTAEMVSVVDANGNKMSDKPQKIQVVNAQSILERWSQPSLEQLNTSKFSKQEQGIMLVIVAVKMSAAAGSSCSKKFELITFSSAGKDQSDGRSEIWTVSGCDVIRDFPIYERSGQVIYPVNGSM